MTKKRSLEFEAIRVATRRPERKWFISRRMAWVTGNWPTYWSFFTGWTNFCLSIGAVENASEKDTAPKSVLSVSLDWRPFGFIIFWRGKCIVWIGDWEWKKGLP